MQKERYTPSDEEMRQGQEMSEQTSYEGLKKNLVKSDTPYLVKFREEMERELTSEIDYMSAVHGRTSETRASQRLVIRVLDDILRERQLKSDLEREVEKMSDSELEMRASLYATLFQERKEKGTKS